MLSKSACFQTVTSLNYECSQTVTAPKYCSQKVTVPKQCLLPNSDCSQKETAPKQ